MRSQQQGAHAQKRTSPTSPVNSTGTIVSLTCCRQAWDRSLRRGLISSVKASYMMRCEPAAHRQAACSEAAWGGGGGEERERERQRESRVRQTTKLPSRRPTAPSSVVLSSCSVSWSLCGPSCAWACCSSLRAPGKMVYMPLHRVGIFTGPPIRLLWARVSLEPGLRCSSRVPATIVRLTQPRAAPVGWRRWPPKSRAGGSNPSAARRRCPGWGR